RELHPPLGRVAGRGPHPLAVGAVARARTHPLLGAVAPIVVLRALVGLAVGASRPLAASRAAALPPLRLVGRLALARSHRAAAVAVLVVSGIRVGRLPPVPLVVIGAAFGPLLVLGAVPFVGVGARPLLARLRVVGLALLRGLPRLLLALVVRLLLGLLVAPLLGLF